MRIFARGGTIRHDLGDGNWVELRRDMSMQARALIMQAMTRVSMDSAGKPQADFDVAAGNIETLRQAIVAWGGPGFCAHDHETLGGPHDETGASNGCHPVPVDREHVELLTEEIGTQLIAAINDVTTAAPRQGEQANP